MSPPWWRNVRNCLGKSPNAATWAPVRWSSDTEPAGALVASARSSTLGPRPAVEPDHERAGQEADEPVLGGAGVRSSATAADLPSLVYLPESWATTRRQTSWVRLTTTG